MQKFQNDLCLSSSVSLDIKASDNGLIEGYASTFGGDADRHGEIVLAGAFSKAIRGHKATGATPVMLWAHAQEQPVGKWNEMHEDERGLFMKGQVNLNTAGGRDAYSSVKAGDVGGLSIGFTVPEGGREYAGKGVFHLKEVELLEVSIVAIPANPLARITAFKSLGSKAEAIEMLRDCGLPKKAAQRFAAGGWQALGQDEEHNKSFQELAIQMDAAINKMRQK